jgi:site-specific recombinase XerD
MLKLSESIAQFKSYMTASGRSSHSIDSYQRELHRLQKFLPQDYPVEQVLANQLDNFLNSDLSQLRFGGGKRKPGSIANTKAALNSFFKWLQGARHIEHNPAITTHIVKQRNLPTYLSPEEEKSLLKTIKEIRGWQAERDFAAISILLYTGVRLSELTGINVADVDLNENKIKLKRTKGGQPETKHINSKLKKVIKPFLERRKEVETECPALFLSQWRRRLSDRQFALRLEMWASRAGIAKKVTPHTLRHTFATNLYAKTKNLLAVQKALGHEYITTTQIYTHIQDEELHSALETL